MRFRSDSSGFSIFHSRGKCLSRELYHLWFGGWIIILFASGCLDQVEIEVPQDGESAVAIQGVLIKANPSKITVNVNKLFDQSSESRTPVPIREILVMDEAGNTEEVKRKTPFIYEATIPADSPLKVEEGQAYQLQVTLGTGQSYISTFESILPLPKPDSLYKEIIEKEVVNPDGSFRPKEFFRFYLNTPTKITDSEQRSYLRWTFERTYKLTERFRSPLIPQDTCYFTEFGEVDNILVFDPASITTDRLDKIPLFDQSINWVLSEGYFFTAYQQVVPQKIFEFWDLAEKLISRQGSMFDPPAGKLRSNFRNVDNEKEEVYGYFYATQQDTLRIYISPDEVGNPPNYCESGLTYYPEFCTDCVKGGGTTEKPDFWIY